MADASTSETTQLSETVSLRITADPGLLTLSDDDLYTATVSDATRA